MVSYAEEKRRGWQRVREDGLKDKGLETQLLGFQVSGWSQVYKSCSKLLLDHQIHFIQALWLYGINGKYRKPAISLANSMQEGKKGSSTTEDTLRNKRSQNDFGFRRTAKRLVEQSASSAEAHCATQLWTSRNDVGNGNITPYPWTNYFSTTRNWLASWSVETRQTVQPVNLGRVRPAAKAERHQEIRPRDPLL